MPKALSTDLRERAVKAYENGEGTLVELGARFGVGEASVKRWVWRWRKDGTLEPRPRPGAPRIVDAEGHEALREIVTAHPDYTRDELADELQQRIGISVSVATMGRMLKRIGWTRKKRRS
jgi:transposase